MNFMEAYPDRCSTVGSAAKAGDVELLRNLIAQGCCISIPDNRGWFPLHEAAAAGNTDCIQILLNHEETEVDWQTFEGETALYLAASGGHAEAVEELLKACATIDLANNESGTPLFQASNHNHEACVKLLLEYKANVNCVYFNGWTPLHTAAYGGHIGILKRLLKAGGKVTTVDDYNITPTFVAAQYGHADCLKILLDSGGDANTQAEDGATALYIAAQEGYSDCIRYLLDAGADPNLLTIDGCKPIHVAAEKNQLVSLELLLTVSQLDYVKGASSWSPLHCTTVNGNIKAAKLILDHGCNVNTGFTNSINRPTLPQDLSPLFHSFTLGATKLFDFLLSRGARLQCEGEAVGGCYMYHLFVSGLKDSASAMKKLLNSGLRIECPCVSPYYFHHNVCKDSQLLLYKYLLDCGLKPRLSCCELCLCSQGPLHRPFLQASLSLAVFYVRTCVANLCPGSVAVLRDSVCWPQLSKVIEAPAPLQHLCRLAIREILRQKGLHRMQEFVSKMVITNIMKSYLLYEDDLLQKIIKT
ncbi:ankyrin repeat and SOCS box protein 3-like [Anneissia japonica]|uniref:ankyrin repeat and SOCS box protein 3-like n=1 Tax=Anneissia japonica TaxID=1529436 RepID=UPI0014257DDA|nr:ankyrin repeat and SOCS box protein 3-like [Anneissia japonica]